jgi:hypothetical protein
MTTILLFLLALTVEIDTATLPLNGVAKVTFAPSGKGEMKRDGTVTTVKVNVEQLRAPSAWGPSLNTYVVWAVSPEGIFENLGELQLDRNKGEFDGTTRLSQLGILITAEPHYMVDRPSSAVAYRSQNTSGETRRTTVTIETGLYDYSGLKPAPPGIHRALNRSRNRNSGRRASR